MDIKEELIMKRIISIFLVALFVFGSFSINSFAQEATKTDLWFENEKTWEFSSDITVYAGDFEIYSYEAYVKNSKMHFKNLPFGNNAKIDLIFDGDNLFFYFSKFPFFYFKIDNELLDLEEPELQEQMTLIWSGKQTIKSTEYYVEEFSDNDTETYKFCFSDDKLELIISKNEFSETYSYISYEQIDDRVFELPFFSINLTPLYKLIEKLFFDL